MECSILVVDDEKDFLESVKRCLMISQYRNFRLMSDPIQAIQLVEGGEAYDLALIDITMPGMDGVEVLTRIKAVTPTTECIMVTAINDLDMATECRNRGASDYLVKPFSGDELVLRIQEVLEKKRRLLAVNASER